MRVNNKDYRTIWPDPHNNRHICIIDQRQLPHKFAIETLTTGEQAISAIREMHVRGAGLIGATAGFAMFLASIEAPELDFTAYLASFAERLGNSRPTARNLIWAIDRVLAAIDDTPDIAEKRDRAFTTACAIADEDALFCKQIGVHGLEIIKEISRKKQGAPVNILTHCNAGWLAFVDHGSATAPIYAARDAGIPVHVWVDETRPWNQGARLTAWELQQENIANTLICDNCGGHLMQHGMVDLVIVGTDRTTHTGDVANKIGTYLKALAAHDNHIPFYVALPSSTFDWKLDNGMAIPIEQRSEQEITTISGKDEYGQISTVTLTASGTKAANYGFDVTPARLVTGLITERGVVKAERKAIHRLFPEHDVRRETFSGRVMKKREQRKFIRHDSLHLLDYIVLDEEGNPGIYSMGRTMDVSVDGIKLETTIPLATDTRLLITIGIEDDLVELEGRTTHAHPQDGRYISGVTFLKISRNGRRVLSKYVEAFRQRKRELLEKQDGAAQ